MAVSLWTIQQDIIVCLTIITYTSQAINLGLIAGDLKPLTNPLSVRKYSKHSPVVININTKHSPLPPLPPISLPKLPSKPPPLFRPSLSSKLAKLKAPFIPKLISKPFVPSIIPRLRLPLPLLPIIPPVLPLLPPILPPILPLLPPILPRMALPLSNPLGPLKVPILGKKSLLEALGSEIKPVISPPLCKKRDNIMAKLLDLKKMGHLTTGEYIRFKKLLLK